LFVKNDAGGTFCTVHQQDASICAPGTGDLVWYENLDKKGTYSATVTRVAPYRGLFGFDPRRDRRAAKKVGMMYNADFGPDMEDVQQWKRTVVAAADEDYRKRGETPPT
jgi:hypothetical protein